MPSSKVSEIIRGRMRFGAAARALWSPPTSGPAVAARPSRESGGRRHLQPGGRRLGGSRRARGSGSAGAGAIRGGGGAGRGGTGGVGGGEPRAAGGAQLRDLRRRAGGRRRRGRLAQVIDADRGADVAGARDHRLHRQRRGARDVVDRARRSSGRPSRRTASRPAFGPAARRWARGSTSPRPRARPG